MAKVKVEGHKNLLRDERSGAIINTDMDSYTAAKNRQRVWRTTQTEISILKDEVTQIKSMLTTIIGTLNNGKDS
jgi:hypothetical protein